MFNLNFDPWHPVAVAERLLAPSFTVRQMILRPPHPMPSAVSLTEKQARKTLISHSQDSRGKPAQQWERAPITRPSWIYFPTSRKASFHRAKTADPRHQLHLPGTPQTKPPSADDSPHRIPRISFKVGPFMIIIILTLGIASLPVVVLDRKTP